MNDKAKIDALRAALRKAYNFGQTYWQQADSESLNWQKKSEETARKFAAFVDETVAALTADASEQVTETAPLISPIMDTYRGMSNPYPVQQEHDALADVEIDEKGTEEGGRPPYDRRRTQRD